MPARSWPSSALIGIGIFACGALLGSMSGPTSPTQAVASPSRGDSAVEARSRNTRSGPTLADTLGKSELERRILGLLFAAPERYLPNGFLDPASGVPKTNVQVICNRTPPSRGFDCAIRLEGHRSIRVSYRPRSGGPSSLVWLPPRK
jgi:hypothetical protein